MKRYPGVSPFTEQQKELFFGREKDIDQLKKLILLRDQILLYSKSGIGKTSLLNAGVLPLFENKYIIVKIRFFAFDDKNPINPLKRIIDALNISIPPKKKASTTLLSEIIQKSEIQPSLWYHFKETQPQTTKKEFLLIFDQFEEIFSYPEHYFKQFKDELYELTKIDVPDSILQSLSENPEFEKKPDIDKLYNTLKIKTVFSIRSDKLNLLNNLSDKLPDIQKVYYELKALNNAQAKEAIVKPVSEENEQYETRAFLYSEKALNSILTALSTSEKSKQNIETTQLQIICQQIENIAQKKQKESKTKITIEEKDLPKFSNIFLEFYNQALEEITQIEGLGGKVKNNIRIFIEDQLIRSNQRIALDSIICKEFINERVLKLLVNKHLLRMEQNSIGGYSYELSHDSLIEAILMAKSERKKQEYLDKIEEDKQKQIKELKERDEKIRLLEIQESLFNAQRLIKLFTPEEKTISTHFEKFFIFEQAKNIINGDFYFFKQTEETTYIGVFDASGSGVHGTLLRVMGYSILDNIIQSNSIPVNEILNRFREKIIQMFKVSENNATDGFDGALCAIDKQNNVVYFSGAKIPLYFVENNNVQILRSNSVSIMYNPLISERNVFDLHQMNIETNKQFYISTDGFTDQLHHQNYKKFQKSNFRKLLTTIQNEPFEQQKQILKTNFENWKKDTEQTDDVLVMGFKI